MVEPPLRDKVIEAVTRLPHAATLQQVLESVVVAARDAPRPELWKLDVNNRYQAAVGVVTSLSTAAMALPIFLLRDVLGKGNGQSISSLLNTKAYVAWALLGCAVFFAIVYYYSSAKWVKLAWRQEADMFWITVEKGFVETVLDASYFIMMTGFVAGILLMLLFAVTFVRP